ncbi:MAG: ATP-binding cassette domain-containing protein, partial [Pseudomonadota bacterium]
MSTDPVLALDGVAFGWTAQQTLIDIADFSIQRGESVFLRGPSGSGKSTLLGLIGGVLVPQRGRIAVDDIDLVTQSPSGRDRVRADRMGVIFQQFNLLPYLSVLNNVTLPCLFSARRRARSLETHAAPVDEARALILRLGLPESVCSEPVGKLSVGQQQRVAAARAL